VQILTHVPLAIATLLVFIPMWQVQIYAPAKYVAAWLSSNALVLINVVALRRARLVLGWVTVRGYTILVFNQTTQAYSAWPSLRG